LFHSFFSSKTDSRVKHMESHKPPYGDHSAILIGVVRGDVHDSHRLWLGRGSVVLGNIHARRAEIEGLVCGDVSATKELIVSAPGVVLGRAESMQPAAGSGAGKGLLSFEPDALHAALEAVDLPPELLFEVYEWVAKHRPRGASKSGPVAEHSAKEPLNLLAASHPGPLSDSDRVLSGDRDEGRTEQRHLRAPRIRAITY